MNVVQRVRRSVRERLISRGVLRREANIPQPTGKPIPAARNTAVILCSPFFNQEVPNAGTTIRVGLARGFEAAGIPYRLQSVYQLRELERLPGPLVILTEADYEFLSSRALQELRRLPHAVWVNPWPTHPGRLYDDYTEGGFRVDQPLRQAVLSSDPRFVFTVSPAGSLDWFDQWVRHGAHVLSVPLACDTELYRRPAGPPRFEGVKVAFVGGYWPYKARNFDQFLKPHEEFLTVYGYSAWPYAGFGGQLGREDEPYLYRDAVLSPAINEPHAQVTGDVCERVFKVLGSGGLCLTDPAPAHRDLFHPEEVLMPASPDEYHDMLREVMREPERFAGMRERGLRAIAERHTYRHRAEQLLAAFGVTATG